MIISLSAVVGITDALSMPSFQSIVPSIVGREQIPAALALNATQFNLSRILGPAVGGVLMVSVGAIGCFALNALSYVPFLWVALWILPRGSVVGAGDRLERGRLLDGVRDIVRSPQLRGALATVLVTSLLCGPLIVFCPVLVKSALQRDVEEFSLTIGAFGVGGLLGAIALLGVDPSRDRRHISSIFAASYGLILVVVAVNQWFWALPALLGLAGLAMAVSNTSANALVQATASPALRGEAVSLYMLAMRGGLAIGSLLTGVSVSLVGVHEALLINGLAALAAQIALGYWWISAPAR